MAGAMYGNLLAWMAVLVVGVTLAVVVLFMERARR